MSTVITRWREGGLAPFDWSSLAWLPMFTPTIRVEDYLEGDRYVIKAELPGVDPVKDVKITYLDGALRLAVSRTEEHKETARSEFHYGTFTRTVMLPAGAMEDTIEATYEAGILHITMKIGEPAPVGKPIPVHVVVTANGKKH
jgi:HSP20 family protein